jgi:[acyl-carrier-protein] S-malonyltransferase
MSAVRKLLVTGSIGCLESAQMPASLGATEFIEFGPGSVLTGLVKRIVPNANLQANA